MSESTVRFSPDNSNVLSCLGGLQELAGSWRGHGFNLISRPDYSGRANLYLQLNQTEETYDVTPIGSPVPNRACGGDGVDLHGLTYLHKVSDKDTHSALHIEPGMWMIQPPAEYPPLRNPSNGQIVYRMSSIPHGNTLNAQGTVVPFSGAPPVLPIRDQPYGYSDFLSFNSTPITGVTPPDEAIMNAAGSSEAGTSRTDHLKPFQQFDLSVAEGPENPRTPYNTHPPEPPLPDHILGVPMQDVVNDPIRLLQADIHDKVEAGYSIDGVAINVMTQAKVGFRRHRNDPYGPHVTIEPQLADGGLTNSPFLLGGVPTGDKGPNAQTTLVYATMWVERLTHPDQPTIMQIQYAQMCVLNFRILLMPDQGIVGWPHISVATLRKTFG